MSTGKKRAYKETFKRSAVMQSYASDKHVSDTAKDLEISRGTLCRWRREYMQAGIITQYIMLEKKPKT